MARIKCVDVSTWQKDVNWKKVKADGYEHAIIRAGFGREVSQKDSEFEQNYKNAKAAGVKLGVYWYSYADSIDDAKREAKACLAVLNGRALDMPVYFDMEESSQTKLGKSVLTAMAKAFCDAIIKGGYRAGIYANPNWFSNYLDYNTLKKSYSIWLAQWSNSYQYDCDVWQYSSKGRVNGIDGDCDVNYIINSAVVKSTGSTNSTTQKPTTQGSTTKPSATSKPSTSKPTTPAKKETVYTVKSGDTLSGIASKYGTTYQKLAEYNGIKSPNLIYVGQKIKIPGATTTKPATNTSKGSKSYTTYKVVKGDTLWGIAEKKLGNGSRYKEIITLNKLKSDVIYAGQTLKIPK